MRVTIDRRIGRLARRSLFARRHALPGFVCIGGNTDKRRSKRKADQDR